jgi:hypothetical protein
LSANQSLESQSLATRQLLHGHIEHGCLLAATIKPPAKFFTIAAKVLYRNVVVIAVHAALEQAERILYGVCMDIATDIRTLVIDRAMPSTPMPLSDYVIYGGFIRLQNGIW